MSNPNAIARAYVHMDEVNEAHSRGEETADERRLRAAREGKQGGEEGSGVALRPARRPHCPKPSTAARAWLRRQELKKERQSRAITDPSEATDTWSRVQHRAGHVAVYPAKPGRRSSDFDRSIDAQIWTKVRQTPGFKGWVKEWISLQEFHARIAAWPLPMTFYAPLPALCEAEVDEQEKGRAEIDDTLRREHGGRLMAGMVRTEDA